MTEHSPYSLERQSASLSQNQGSTEELKQEDSAYFSELLSYSLERLSKEPELLRADQEHIRRQIEDTTVEKYRAFLTTAQCLADLRQQLQAATGSLDALVKDLPKLQAATEQFKQDAAAANAKRADNRLLYNTHSTLLELLEVPQLMDTCIRNGNYDEALDLRTFVHKMSVMHGDLPVVQRLVADVGEVSASMLEQLLQRLQASIQLPECLRVIGYLRRLAAFTEQDLRLQFLQRRERWIADLVADLDDHNAYELMKRLTDVYRLHLFDVVMQYRAIFSDDGGGQDARSRDGGILYAWAERRVAKYLEAVRLHLPRITEGGSLASVLDHAMYCSMSLGRVGLDFRPLLAPLFEECILSLFSQTVLNSTTTLHGLLETHKWIAMPASLAARRASSSTPGTPSSATVAASGGGDRGSGGGELDPSAGPPYSLMEHTPLAVYANGLLSAFNELRHCAPLSLREAAAAVLEESLGQVATTLSHYGESRPLSESELPVFESACRAFAATLCPYVAACFDRIYAGGGALLDVRKIAAPALEAVRSQ
ncbi:hypothetical protein N2152v2_008959 [Parachlorella kessleri]